MQESLAYFHQDMYESCDTQDLMSQFEHDYNNSTYIQFYSISSHSDLLYVLSSENMYGNITTHAFQNTPTLPNSRSGKFNMLALVMYIQIA